MQHVHGDVRIRRLRQKPAPGAARLRKAREVDDLALAVAARYRGVERVALEIELIGEERVDDAGGVQTAPVRVHDRLGGGLRRQRPVAEQLEEEPGLLVWVGRREALALVRAEHVRRLSLRGGEGLGEKGDVLAALPIGERGRFVHGCSHVADWNGLPAGVPRLDATRAPCPREG